MLVRGFTNCRWSSNRRECLRVVPGGWRFEWVGGFRTKRLGTEFLGYMGRVVGGW
jgi:hypothetical protein